VVDDGSTDDTAAVLARFDDPRIRIITQPENRGLPAARNAGVDAAAGAWIVYGEDDCRFPADYATVLRDEAITHGADIVGAPWLHVESEDAIPEALEARRGTAEDIGLESVDVVPPAAVVTPFVPSRALFRRTVFDQIRWDEGYLVNAWREETDFTVRATRAGFTCLLTPRTYCYQVGSWSGGARRSRLRYEWWALRNNWRFLHRHGRWLAERGEIRGPVREQLSFAARRAWLTAAGTARARWERLIGRA
jgi:GT2 family glycosyltransferase